MGLSAGWATPAVTEHATAGRSHAVGAGGDDHRAVSFETRSPVGSSGDHARTLIPVGYAYRAARRPGLKVVDGAPGLQDVGGSLGEDENQLHESGRFHMGAQG